MTKYKSYITKSITKSLLLIKGWLEFSTYYTFKVNLCLLEFFTRKIPYLFFIFAFIFGTFGNTKDLPFSLLYLKIICFIFSWYLLYISVVIFCVFNISICKNYLYDLLGKEFVISKIGNPSLTPLRTFAGAALALVTGNEVGRKYDGQRLICKADNYIDKSLPRIATIDALDTEGKALETRKAYAFHRKLLDDTPKGPFDRVLDGENVPSIIKTILDFKKK